VARRRTGVFTGHQTFVAGAVDIYVIGTHCKFLVNRIETRRLVLFLHSRFVIEKTSKSSLRSTSASAGSLDFLRRETLFAAFYDHLSVFGQFCGRRFQSSSRVFARKHAFDFVASGGKTLLVKIVASKLEDVAACFVNVLWQRRWRCTAGDLGYLGEEIELSLFGSFALNFVKRRGELFIVASDFANFILSDLTAVSDAA